MGWIKGVDALVDKDSKGAGSGERNPRDTVSMSAA